MEIEIPFEIEASSVLVIGGGRHLKGIAVDCTRRRLLKSQLNDVQ